MRKPTIYMVSEWVLHKPSCTSTEDGLELEFSDFCSIRIAKTMALISCAFTDSLSATMFSPMHVVGFLVRQ